MPRQLHFAMVCASNQNRSMEAHAVLKQNGFFTSSYGVGAHVKLPGPSQKEPNVYKVRGPWACAALPPPRRRNSREGLADTRNTGRLAPVPQHTLRMPSSRIPPIE